MNKIALLCDPHFGARGDSNDFHEYFKMFYDEIFFPYLIVNNIQTVILLGDAFDRRKFVNINSLYQARGYFFNKFKKLDINLSILLGNHDVFYKDTLRVNSPQLLLEDIKNVKIIMDFETIMVNDVPIDIIPWLCEENTKSISESIKESKSQICFGHFEINGFEMDRGNVFKGGNFEKNDLNKYDMVITGHFHHKSDDNHIYYLGTPYQLTWSDYGDPRGFHIFDVNTRSIEFIENPRQMFHKINYDDSVQNEEYWKEQDLTMYKNTYIKIVVLNKSNPFLFDSLLDRLEKIGAYDIGIVEDFTIVDGMEEIENTKLDQTQDTISILNKWIDNQEFSIDVDKLKAKMREIYIEAINVGKNE
jgi:hypothetical protein